MKNFLILLLLFLLYPTNQIFPQIKPGGILEFGYEDRVIGFEDNFGNKYGTSWLTKKEFADLNLNISYKKIYIYTNVKTYFIAETLCSYNPFQVEYRIGMNYQIDNNKRFLFNVEHLCSHSIESKEFFESYNRISLKIRFF